MLHMPAGGRGLAMVDVMLPKSLSGALPTEPMDGLPTVLQVIPNLETGGAERGTLDVAAGLRARGVRAVVSSAGGRMVRELERTGAEHVILCTGRHNTFGFPSPEVSARWQAAGARLWDTAVEGEVRVTVMDNRVTVRGFRER